VGVTGDIVAGTNFMHNVYALFSTTGLNSNSNARSNSTSNSNLTSTKEVKGDRPFVQLLPLTNPEVAHREFLASQSANGDAVSDRVANSQSTVDFDAERKRLGLDSGATRSVTSWVLTLGAALGFYIVL
jgi:hypothetical protein